VVEAGYSCYINDSQSLTFIPFLPKFQHFTKQHKLTNDHTAQSSEHLSKYKLNTVLLPSNQLTTDALSHNGNQKRANPWPPWTCETKSLRLAQSCIYVCHPALPNPELVKLSSRIKL
jgi:hypothetical protein